MDMDKEMNIQAFFEVNRTTDFSYRLGRAIAGACDERRAGFGLPLGDFEIAMEEDVIPPPATMRGEETYGEESSGKRRYRKIRKRMRNGLAEFKKLLATDWGERDDNLIDS